MTLAAASVLSAHLWHIVASGATLVVTLVVVGVVDAVRARRRRTRQSPRARFDGASMS